MHPIEIEPWLRARRYAPDRIEALSGDVSARRYYRLESGDASSILAYYPESIRDACGRFLATTRLLKTAGVEVPEVLDADPQGGYVLLEDLGNGTLYDLRAEGWETLRPWLRQAIEHRSRILALPRQAVERLNPALDEDLLERELGQALHWLLEPWDLLAEPSLARRFHRLLSAVCRELGSGESAPCHRDFMARNLMPGTGRLVVIDHQDLRIGPAAYDLASLLNDSLFLPPQEEEWFLQELAAGVEQRRQYRLAAVQRTLKAAGTFAVFAHRGHPRHLPLIAPTLDCTLRHLAAIEEGAELAARLATLWPPRIAARLARRKASGRC